MITMIKKELINIIYAKIIIDLPAVSLPLKVSRRLPTQTNTIFIWLVILLEAEEYSSFVQFSQNGSYKYIYNIKMIIIITPSCYATCEEFMNRRNLCNYK